MELFCEDVSRATNSENTNLVLVIRDFNTKIGERTDSDTCWIGKFGLGDRNAKGQLLSSLLEKESLYCLFTFFKKIFFPFLQKKNAIDNIVDPLVTVTYDCLRDGIFPDVLKIAKTVSVPKKWSFT